MKLKMIVEKEIENCNQCPFHGIDGGTGPAMICKHPSIDNTKLENAYVISHPECDTGFPEKCPLLKSKAGKVYKKTTTKNSVLDSRLKELAWTSF
jgi:hypothetical protein